MLVDFGLAQGPGVGAAGIGRGWTPQYAAPEQLARAPLAPPADAFAVGIMILEALTGRRPQRGRDRPDPPTLPDGLPDDLARLLTGLLDADAHTRLTLPDALELLGHELDAGAHALLDEIGVPTQAADLERLFHGRISFEHPAERAAALLWSETDGDPEALLAELSRWVRAGLIHVDTDTDAADRIAFPDVADRPRFRVDLPRLAALESGLLRDREPAGALHEELRSLIRSKAGAPRIQEAALRLSRTQRDAGRLGAAMATLDVALAVVRVPSLVRPMLQERAALALATQRTRELELSVYLLDRSGVGLAEVRTLLLAAAAFHRHEAERAWRLLDELSTFTHEDLEIWRVGLGVGNQTARNRRHDLEALEGWSRAGSARRRARWLGWMDLKRYEEERYAEALDFHLQAARSKRPHQAISSLTNAIGAALELPDPELAEAHRLVDEARAYLREHPEPFLEVRVERLAREIASRRGEALRPRPDLVAAMRQVHRIQGLIGALTEAAIAWRAGELRTCRELASEIVHALGERPESPLYGLAVALGVACGLDHAPEPVLAQVGGAGRVAEIDLQILGLLTPPGGSSRALALRLYQALPEARRSRRLDVISPDEAIARLGLSLPGDVA